MRRTIVFILLLLMSAALVALLLLRERAPASRADSVSAGADAGAAAPPAPKSGAADGAAATADRDAAPAKKGEERTPELDRPLRVVGLGWDPLVPGIIANDGISPGAESRFRDRELTVQFRAVSSMSEAASALALGGAEDEGADVAIAPLPSVVASYEDVQALRPKVFFVIGWSRGREAIAGGRKALIELPRRGEITVAAEAGAPPALFTLFLLDLATAEPERTRLLDPEEDQAKSARFVALDRTGEDAEDSIGSRRILATTADAPRLIPYVAIAPEGFLEAHPEAVESWAAAWLEGVEEMRADVPGAARKVSAVEGAPEPLGLLKRLGQIDLAGLEENARVAGLAGRGAVTIEELFSRTWRLWRRAGILSTPAPEAAPLSTAAITALVLARSGEAEAAEGQTEPSFRTGTILRIERRDPDASRLVETLGLVAGVFSRSALRVGVDRSGRQSRELIEQAAERYDLPRARMRAAPRLSRRGSAVIEVLAAP